MAVADSTNSARVPTGEVDIKNGGATLGSGQIGTDGVAKITFSLPVGTYSLTPVYVGNSDFKGSQQDPTTVQVTPNPAFFSTVMLVPFPVTANQTTTFSATISNGTQGGTSIPTGEVDIRNGGDTIGSGMIDGSGNLTIQFTLQAGTYNLDAAYLGNSHFKATATSLPPLIVKAATPTPTTPTPTSPTPTSTDADIAHADISHADISHADRDTTAGGGNRCADALKEGADGCHALVQCAAEPELGDEHRTVYSVRGREEEGEDRLHQVRGRRETGHSER